jgi:hypothetical protein
MPGPLGIQSGIGRFGAYGPTNSNAPSGNNPITGDPDKQWYESGPFWTLVFVFAGWFLVFKTLR